MDDSEQIIRTVESELADAEDREASVLALMTKTSDPDLRRHWAECAESLRRQVTGKKQQLRHIRLHRCAAPQDV